MKQEKSCGAVVYRAGETYIDVLLIQHRNGGHWAFPKGHVERGETEEETALREILEETGLPVALDPGFRETVSYSPKAEVWKQVVYFAAAAGNERPKCQQEEVLALQWLSVDEAMKVITFDNDKKVLQSFAAYFKQRMP